MRIARIIEYFPPHIGGMERHGLILSLEQVKFGHSIDVFIGFGNNSGYSDKNLEHSDYEKLNIYRMPFQFLPLYSKIRRFWFNFWVYNKVKKIHQKNPYEIIHLHGDFIEGCFGGKLFKKLRVPAILTIHAGLNKRLLKPKNAVYFENISKIICVSDEVASDLKNIGIPENKLIVISSGIYLNEFENIDRNKIIAIQNQYSKPFLISVGVLRSAKGFEYLIEAFKSMKEKFSEASLLIAGDGPDRNALEKQAKDIGGVYFLGCLNHDKVIEYLKSADIFVLASISAMSSREGTPTSIMEAMAAGLPIVATKSGGIPSLIKDGINGLLVEEKNSAMLAEAIIKLINNEDLKQKIRARNLEDIKPKDWSVIARRITDLY